MPVIAKLIHGDRKEWVTRHSQWKVLPHDDASSTGLSALFQLCWGLSTLGPYGPLRNGGSPATPLATPAAADWAKPFCECALPTRSLHYHPFIRKLVITTAMVVLSQARARAASGTAVTSAARCGAAFSTQMAAPKNISNRPSTRKIAVLGSGSFGTAMGTVLGKPQIISRESLTVAHAFLQLAMETKSSYLGEIRILCTKSRQNIATRST